jgi:TRAP-type C4-dicarboxylate transport system substrate-binding protein
VEKRKKGEKMDQQTKWVFLLILFVIIISRFVLPAEVIKIGSIAPSRSIWDKALNDLAVEWAKISGGNIQLKIYPGGIVGGELDMLTKMRLGTLNGAILSDVGITAIYEDSFALNTPFLMDTEEEFNYIFERMKPEFEKQIEKRGFKVLMWMLVGWDYFFAKEKMIYPEDLKKFKLSFMPSGTDISHAWNKMGYQIIPNDLKDLLMALQSNMVSAFYLPPLLAGSGQFFALAPHMLRLRLVPIIGSLILTEQAWKKIPAQYHEPMMKSIARLSKGLYQQSSALELEVLKMMQENGLIIHEPPPDALGRWRAVAAKGMDELVDKVFSKEIYERILALLAEYKLKHGK